MTDPLLAALLGAPDDDSVDLPWRLGTVTAISPALLVQVGASTTGKPCTSAASVALAVGDFVVVLINGPDRVVVASLTGTPHDRLGTGAPAGTGTNGDEYWDLTNKRLYRSDGAGWIIMAEPTITSFAPTVTSTAGVITTVGAVTFSYHRCDGWVDWFASVAITTAGAGAAGFLLFTFPMDSASQGNWGSGRERLVTGKTVWVQRNAAAQAFVGYYDNNGVVANGVAVPMSGRFQMATRYS